jgi:hypothetical protein
MNFTENILSVYRSADFVSFIDGLNWYETVHEMARDLHPNVVKSAGVLSALSPRMPWHRNVALAETCIAGDLTGGALKRSIGNANAIRNGANPWDVLGGLKTRAFFINILDPMRTDVVTVDTHAIKIAGLDRDSVGKGLYMEIQQAYIDAANVAGIRPNQMQAVTWMTYRDGLKPRIKESKVFSA